jgi:hypothetical protein
MLLAYFLSWGYKAFWRAIELPTQTNSMGRSQTGKTLKDIKVQHFPWVE